MATRAPLASCGARGEDMPPATGSWPPGAARRETEGGAPPRACSLTYRHPRGPFLICMSCWGVGLVGREARPKRPAVPGSRGRQVLGSSLDPLWGASRPAGTEEVGNWGSPTLSTRRGGVPSSPVPAQPHHLHPSSPYFLVLGSRPQGRAACPDLTFRDNLPGSAPRSWGGSGDREKGSPVPHPPVTVREDHGPTNKGPSLTTLPNPILVLCALRGQAWAERVTHTQAAGAWERGRAACPEGSPRTVSSQPSATSASLSLPACQRKLPASSPTPPLGPR